MQKKVLNLEEIRSLSDNPFVTRVSSTNINYSEEFKLEVKKRLQKGEKPSKVIVDLGFDIKILGKDRIKGITKRCRNYKRENNSNKVNQLQDENNKLKKQLLIYKQENEYLKKTVKQSKR